MKSLLKNIRRFALAHKAVSTIAVIVVVGGGLTAYKNATTATTTTRYIFETAKKGDIASTVTGSGQISALDTVDIQSNVAGTLTSVLVAAGDEVQAGQTIATLDPRNAVNDLSNAQLKVTSAEIALEKAQRAAAVQSATSSSSDIKKAYQSGYDAIANSFKDFPGIFQDVSDILYNSSHSAYFSDANILANVDATARAYKINAGALFDKAKAGYDTNYAAYRSITADSDPAAIDAFLTTTYAVLKDLSAGLSGTYSTIDYIGSKLSVVPAQLTTDKSLVSTYLSKIDDDMAAVSNAQTAISDAQDKSISVDLDLKTAELDLKTAKEAVIDAENNLADQTIRAPFSGIIAKVPIDNGTKIAAGTSITTLITKKMQATLTMNEIDAAKVRVGQKASLTFDAISGLTLSGTVSSVDVAGTVSNGVVSYGVKIALDTVDDRLKSGMTTTVAIASDSHAGVIVVPTTAISVKNGKSYVQIEAGSSTAPAALSSVPVETGLTNDTQTEIVSGLTEGQRFLARTVTISTAKSTAGSLLSLFGPNRQGNRSATSSGGPFRQP